MTYSSSNSLKFRENGPQYALERATLTSGHRQTISQDEYHLLKAAREILDIALQLERRYDALHRTFFMVEGKFDALSKKVPLEYMKTLIDLFDTLQEADIHVVMFVAAISRYLEQAPRSFKGALKPLREQAYQLVSSARTGPRFQLLKAVRNHSLHFAEAVHSCSVTGGAARSVEFASLTSKFAENRYKAVQDVVSQMPAIIDIRSELKAGMVELGYLHLSLRSLISDKVNTARELMLATLERYAMEGDGETSGLVARRVDNIEHPRHGEISRETINKGKFSALVTATDVQIDLLFDDIRIHWSAVNTTGSLLQG